MHRALILKNAAMFYIEQQLLLRPFRAFLAMMVNVTMKTAARNKKRNRGRTSLCAAKKRNGKFGCVMGGLSVSGSVHRESERLANQGTDVGEGWKVVSIYFCIFYQYFWRA